MYNLTILESLIRILFGTIQVLALTSDFHMLFELRRLYREADKNK